MLARGLKKFICRLIAITLVLCIAAVVFYGCKGYEMYKEAVLKTPVSSIAEDICSREHFTEYESLPQIYMPPPQAEERIQSAPASVLSA